MQTKMINRRGASCLVVVGIMASIAFVFLIIFGVVLYRGYNGAIARDEEVRSKWAQVENQLQRRFDLIPNLVETVKGVAGQEDKIFLGIAEARKSYFAAKSIPDKAVAAGKVESALHRLMLYHEKYPELRSSQAFLKLQDQLEGTENRLTVERGRYNDSVKELNYYCRSLFGRWYASWAGVQKAEYFEIEEAVRATPQVNFAPE